MNKLTSLAVLTSALVGFYFVGKALVLSSQGAVPLIEPVVSQEPQEGNVRLETGVKMFGSAVKSKIPSSKVEDSELEAVIEGLMITKKRAVAVIRYKGVSKTFLVGDAMSKGVRVASISGRGVIIDNSGRYERLYYKEKPIKSGSSPNLSPAIKSDDLKEFVRQFRKSPALLLDHIAFKPKMDFQSKSFAGFLVNAKNGSRLFYSAGFKDGDVVKSINGIGFRSLDTVQERLVEIVNSQSIRFLLLRDGAEHKLVLDLS